MKSNSGSAAPLSLCVVLFVLGIVQLFIIKAINDLPGSYIQQGIQNIIIGLIVPLILAMIALIGGMTHSYGILLIVKIGGLAMLLIQVVSNVVMAFWMMRYYEKIMGMGIFATILANMPGIGLLNTFLIILRNPVEVIKAGVLVWTNLLLSIINNLLGITFTLSLFSVRD